MSDLPLAKDDIAGGDPVAALQLAGALLDENRRRFEASERRFDDLRNRARNLAAAVAALLALDLGLVSSFLDPAKKAPVASLVLALGGVLMHVFLLRVLIGTGYGFEPGRGLPNPKGVGVNALEKGHFAMVTDLWKHYANTAASLDARYAKLTHIVTGCSERLANSLAFPVLAVLYFACMTLNR